MSAQITILQTQLDSLNDQKTTLISLAGTLSPPYPDKIAAKLAILQPQIDSLTSVLVTLNAQATAAATNVTEKQTLKTYFDDTTLNRTIDNATLCSDGTCGICLYCQTIALQATLTADQVKLILF